jgi:hypothetical protein
MGSGRWRRAAYGLLAGAIALQGVATSLSIGNAARRLPRELGDGFVDYASWMDIEFAPAAHHLGDRGYVEYVSDVPYASMWADQARSARFTLIQYAIAPTILGHIPLPADEPQRQFLLADFPDAAALDAYLEANPCEVRWRRGGRALLRRR